MVMQRRFTHLEGGLIAAIGLVLFVTNVEHGLIEPPVTVAFFLGSVVPGFLGLLVVAGGLWVSTAEIGERNARIFLWWTFLGVAVAGGMALVITYYEASHGVRLVHANHVIMNNVAGGAVGGLIVGYFHTLSRQRAAKLAANRDSLAESRENFEMLARVLRHDISNDLQVALGMLNHARQNPGEVDDGNTDPLARTQRALRNAQFLTETAGEFIRQERGESNGLDSVDVRSIVQQQVESVRDAYPDASVEIGDIPDVQVLANDMLSSVIRNLLTNAIQHNPEDSPRVAVAVEERGDRVVFTVWDNGPGIPDDQKDNVFGKGEQGLESEGSGIGLYLVDALVEQYDGDVRVEDRAEHETAGSWTVDEPDGSVFVVELQTP